MHPFFQAVPFINSMATLFSAHQVLIFQNETSDLDYSYWIENSDNFTQTFQVMDASDDFEIEEIQSRKLIFCTAAPSGNMLRLGLKSDAVWLIPFDVLASNYPQDLRLDSNWITFEQVNGKVFLKEHYRIKRTTLVHNNLGTWSEQEGLSIEQPYIWNRRRNLQGVNVTTATFTYPPLSYASEKNRTIQLRGYIPDVVQSLQQGLNFTVTPILQTTTESGNPRIVNGSLIYTGVVGKLWRGEFDMATNGITVVYERSLAIDYTFSVATQIATLAISDPDFQKDKKNEEKINMSAYVTIFSTDVWISILVVGLLVSLLYALIESWYDHSQMLKTMVNGASAFLQTLAQTGGDPSKVKIPSGKVLLLFATFVCFFTYQCYVGDLTAKMTVTSDNTKLKNFQDVLDSGYTVRIFNNTSYEIMFKTAPEGSLLSKIYKDHSEVINIPKPRNIKQFLDSIHNTPKVALFFSVDIMTNYGLVAGGLKPLLNFHERQIKHKAIGLQKDSEFTSLFNYELTRLRQSGLFERLEFKWVKKSTPEDGSHRYFVQDILILGSVNLYFPSLVLLIGVTAGLVIVVSERVSKGISKSQMDIFDNAIQFETIK